MLSLGAATLAQSLLQQGFLQRWQPLLTPETSDEELWQRYRWAINPEDRREAALLMVGRDDGDPIRRSRLLQGQGWGKAPLAAVALALSATTAEQRGDDSEAKQLWHDLLRRFPESSSSAWARQRLGTERPDLHQQLLRLQPAHPAALMAAARMEPDGIGRHRGAVHLARWGVAWPGAGVRLKDACRDSSNQGPRAEERQLLAQGLARLGEAGEAGGCLLDAAPEPATALAIGRTLLRGDRSQRREGEQQLLTLSRDHPQAAESREAARLLSDPLLPNVAVLDAVPDSLATGSAAMAAGRVRLAQGTGAAKVIQRWPQDPAIWQLQWDLAREALLNGQWVQARRLLGLLKDAILPAPLEARRLFWLGFSADRSGDQAAAIGHWNQLIEQQPTGYYSWLAMRRLGDAAWPDLNAISPDRAQDGAPGWTPLNSTDPLVNTLWRLDLEEEAWEQWRSGQDPEQPLPHREQLVEGRLRIAIGDLWTGLDRLWRLSLRWLMPDCDERQQLQRSQLPRLYSATFRRSAEEHRLNIDLLYAITKQESRFSPGVQSVVGATGLMQLMPATASELAGRPLLGEELYDPATNIDLGAAYLRQLLDRWNGHPLLAIASYNAGPGAVNAWRTAELDGDPELWVERIPYPETRYYTKRVMDNLLRYSAPNRNRCEKNGGRKLGTQPQS